MRNAPTPIAFILLSLLLGLAACSDSDSGAGLESAQPAEPELSQPYGDFFSEQYANLDNWLCHVDQADEVDICDSDLSTLSVNADGSSTVELHEPAANPAVDCFYVYPTVSADLTPNSDLIAGAEEIIITRNQAARYNEVCRVFAPMYRQSTVLTIVGDTQGDRELAYGDALDAFRHYMANYNEGRGYILIGHSQGSSVLARLVQEEIETDAFLLDRLISAHLIGASLRVAEGTDIAAGFSELSVCRNNTQAGCLVSYVSYREGDPYLLAGEARFGRPGDGEQAICVNPAALAGGKAELDTYINTESSPLLDVFLIRRVPGPYKDPDQYPEVSQLFYKMPGLVSGECKVAEDGVSYLEISLNPSPDGARADDINGEMRILGDWGLHLVDINLAIGNLVDLAAAQAESWLQDH